MSRAAFRRGESSRFSVCVLGQIHALDDDYVVEELRPGVAGCCVAKTRGRDRRRRRGWDKDTRGRAEAYNCRRTELDSKAATTHKDTTGRYYNNVQVSCRHLKGPHCFSRGTAIFGRTVRGKRYIYIHSPHRGRKMTFSSASTSLTRVVFDPEREDPGGKTRVGFFKRCRLESPMCARDSAVFFVTQYS